jgi:predicted nucleotidyltransferase
MPNIAINVEQIAEFCRRWGVKELALFGSVLRDDFAPESDVDVLVSFEPGRGGDPFEHIDMERELAAMLGREVDLVVRSAVERSRNWLRRREILETARTLYAA